MIMNVVLKLTKYTNTPGTFEAEWFTREVTPAVGTEGEEGYQPESTKDTPQRVTAYSANQIEIFRADVVQHGGAIDESLLAEVQAELETTQPPPPLTPKELLNKLDAENALTQRNLRETVMLMAEAFKTSTNGAVDLSTIPGVAKVYAVEAEAAALRASL